MQPFSFKCNPLLLGGIEALFLILEDDDNTMQANALWALCNLSWSPTNQERAGRFITSIYPFLSSSYHPVKIQAFILISNILYYNAANRGRFLELEGSMELLLSTSFLLIDCIIESLPHHGQIVVATSAIYCILFAISSTTFLAIYCYLPF